MYLGMSGHLLSGETHDLREPPPSPDGWAYVIAYTCMPEARTWDGRSYDRISGPMEALGLAVLARLELNGDELVLDAGCGSGRITQALIERLPEGHVIAVDVSASMVAAARERLPGADV